LKYNSKYVASVYRDVDKTKTNMPTTIHKDKRITCCHDDHRSFEFQTRTQTERFRREQRIRDERIDRSSSTQQSEPLLRVICISHHTTRETCEIMHCLVDTTYATASVTTRPTRVQSSCDRYADVNRPICASCPQTGT